MNFNLPSTQSLFAFESLSVDRHDERNENSKNDMPSNQAMNLNNWNKENIQVLSDPFSNFFYSQNSFQENGNSSQYLNHNIGSGYVYGSDPPNELPLRNEYSNASLKNYNSDTEPIKNSVKEHRLNISLNQMWEGFAAVKNEFSEKCHSKQVGQDARTTLEQRQSSKGFLRSVNEIPQKYRTLFSHFPFFNIVQSTVFDDVFNSDKPIVVSAPTGSGKTVIMELAILRLLMQNENPKEEPGFWESEVVHTQKIIYMAPLKALVGERYLDWKDRFGALGLTCAEITGDTFHDDFDMFKNSRIILTTPEKWDSLTRRWRDNTNLMKTIKLLLIDEVHLLNEEMRGPTLEAVISRMKTIRSIYHKDKNSLRMIAVSATIPNVDDVASWLKIGKEPAISHKLEEHLRPVQLRRVILAYPCHDSWNDFRFDLSLNYKLASIIHSYSNNKPTLIFASTRKGAQQTAFVLRREARLVRDSKHKEILTVIANGLKDNKLRECVLFGIGFHHAGVDVSDRRQVEALFLEGNLPVLVSTSTLAMGVNLPAHLVVIKSTSHYVNGEYKEYPSAQILQMVGRAGRPQFDDHGTAVIMTKSRLKAKYESLVTGRDVLESHLHKHLIEHLNAEGWLRDEGGLMPQIPNDTRWNSQEACVDIFIKNVHKYMEINTEQEIDGKIATALNDAGLYREALHLQKRLKEVAIALDKI